LPEMSGVTDGMTLPASTVASSVTQV
jgi:hypothetical protein